MKKITSIVLSIVFALPAFAIKIAPPQPDTKPYPPVNVSKPIVPVPVPSPIAAVEICKSIKSLALTCTKKDMPSWNANDDTDCAQTMKKVAVAELAKANDSIKECNPLTKGHCDQALMCFKKVLTTLLKPKTQTSITPSLPNNKGTK